MDGGFTDKRGFVDTLWSDWQQRKDKSFICSYFRNVKAQEAEAMASCADLSIFIDKIIASDGLENIKRLPSALEKDFSIFIIRRNSGKNKYIYRDRYVLLLACRMAAESSLITREAYHDVFRLMRKRNGHLAKKYIDSDISERDVDDLLRSMLNGMITDYFRNEKKYDKKSVSDSVEMLLRYQSLNGPVSGSISGASRIYDVEYKCKCRKLFDLLRNDDSGVINAREVFIPLLINEGNFACLCIIGSKQLNWSDEEEGKDYSKFLCYPCVIYAVPDYSNFDNGGMHLFMKKKVFEQKKNDAFTDAWGYYASISESQEYYGFFQYYNGSVRRGLVPDEFIRYFEKEPLPFTVEIDEQIIMDEELRKEEKAREEEGKRGIKK